MSNEQPWIHVKGKVAIVTGGTRGIGEAIALALGKAGAKVVVASRKPEGVAEAVENLRIQGIEVDGYACHVGKREDVEQLVAKTAARFGKADILVNNAATNPHYGPLLSIDDAAFDKTLEVNLKGYLYAIRALVRHLSDRGGSGSIINIASIAALYGAPMQGAYAMTKAAILSMTETLACELASSGVRVNAIAPGLVETRFSSAIFSNRDLVKAFLGRTPQARFGKPEDIAGAALYLASDASSYVTGQTLVVDGGLTISGI